MSHHVFYIKCLFLHMWYYNLFLKTGKALWLACVAFQLTFLVKLLDLTWPPINCWPEQTVARLPQYIGEDPAQPWILVKTDGSKPGVISYTFSPCFPSIWFSSFIKNWMHFSTTKHNSMVKNSELAVVVVGVSRIKNCIVKMTVVCWHNCVIQSFIHFYIIQPYNELYIWSHFHSYNQSWIKNSPTWIFWLTVLHSVC